ASAILGQARSVQVEQLAAEPALDLVWPENPARPDGKREGGCGVADSPDSLGLVELGAHDGLDTDLLKCARQAAACAWELFLGLMGRCNNVDGETAPETHLGESKEEFAATEQQQPANRAECNGRHAPSFVDWGRNRGKARGPDSLP